MSRRLSDVGRTGEANEPEPMNDDSGIIQILGYKFTGTSRISNKRLPYDDYEISARCIVLQDVIAWGVFDTVSDLTYLFTRAHIDVYIHIHA